MLSNSLLTVAFLVVQLWQCNGEDIQYSYKVDSDSKRDDFAASLATAPHRLVVGAPRGNYILPVPGVKVRAPQGRRFGRHLDMNEQFMVVSGEDPTQVYVYSSTHPYTLVAMIRGPYVEDVKVSEHNNIFVATVNDFVSVYKYTQHSSWDKHQDIFLKPFSLGHGISLAVFGDMLAVGHYDGDHGQVKIYKKVNDQYTKTATLRPTEQVSYFGISVAIEGRYLVVSSWEGILFTYELDPSGGRWMMNGRFAVHSPYASPVVSLQNYILAATVSDPPNNAEVCAFVYKLSNNNHPHRNKNNSVSNTGLRWKKVATLKTNGVPITTEQYYSCVSVQDGLIFTGRRSCGSPGDSMVFAHDLNKY